ncbi:MAG: ArnT family glycosyltransferase [Thermoguttaceae bacterium]
MPRKVVCLCHVVVMLGLFALQAIHLDCDPAPLKPMNDFADEGLWNHNARCKALFGSFTPDDLSLALVAAPLFTALQWLVFSVCGVSYFSARLLCLVSLWLIMLMVYYLMGRQFSWGVGLLAAATLGVAQEMLMYTKWATPVMPEMMFLTAVLFFWELGRTGSRRWMAVSGACFIAALLSKMTSLQVLPALAVFLAGSYWLRRDIDLRRLLYFVLSAGVLGLLVGLCYLPFLHSWAFVSRNLWQNVWNFQNPDVKELGGGLIHIWFLAPMTCPGGFLLTMLLSLWFVDAIVRAARHGLRCALREISTIEFYSLCWLVCTLLVLVVVPYKPARRFAMLAIPLALLAVSFAARTLGRPATAGEPSCQPAVMALSQRWRVVLGIATVAVWCRYAYKTLALVRQDWFCLDPTTVPRLAWVLAGAAGLAVGVLFFIFRRPRATVKLLLAAYFIVSFTVDGIWYARASFTIRDLSGSLGKDSRPGQYISGQWAYELCLDNQRMPILCDWHGGAMNKGFADHNDELAFTVFILDSLGERPWQKGDRFQCDIDRFPPPRVKHIEAVQLCPVIFSPTSYRVRGQVYAIRPLH